MQQATERKLRRIVRIANTDLDGDKQLYYALTKIHGVSYSFANAICNVLNLDKIREAGSLSPEEVKKIEDFLTNPAKYDVPVWLYNRRKDLETGENIHLIGPSLKLRKEFDIKSFKKIKSYRGIRHAMGLPVRGQRTRAHFRKGAAIGVQKKKIKMALSEKKAEGKKKE